MRVFEESVGPNNKKRILFACGIEDIKILYGLVTKAKMFTPSGQQVPELVDIEHRLSSMSKEFKNYLSETDRKPKYGKQTPCPYCERKLRGERALGFHIKQVHSKEVGNDTSSEALQATS